MARFLPSAAARGTAAASWAALLLVWLAGTAFMLARLPDRPYLMGDSPSYIELAAHRPPAFGWLLQALRAAGDGAEYVHLPLTQTLLIAVALLAFAWQLAVLLRSPLAAAAVILLVWAHTAVLEAAYSVMSEGLFLSALLWGLACACAHARSGSMASLAGVAFFCALATLTRNAGAALFLLPLVLVLLDAGDGARRMLRRLALVALVAALPLLAGMTWHYARHGVFTLGSYAGISLLGRSTLLLRPAQAGDEVLARVAPLAEEARAAVAAAPDYAASLRAQIQAIEDLRWRVFVPAAAAAWPAWREADSGGQSRIAGAVALPIIAADPVGYAKLAVRDWSALVLYPHFWPTAWRAENTAHPFFARCGEARRRCWWFERLEVPRFRGLAMLGVSVGGLLASAVLLVVFGARAARRRLEPPERLMLAMVAATQATLAGTALFEFGIWRYTLAPHAMHAALLAWLAVLAFARISRGSS